MDKNVPVPSIEDLFADLKHPNPRIQEDACAIMVEHYSQEALPRLIDLLTDKDPKVYRAAVKGIGFFGTPAFAPLLDLYATTDNQTARRCCPKAFVQLFKNHPNQSFPDEVMALLENGIHDDDMVVVQGVLMCLGQIGKQEVKATEAIQILSKSLKSDNIALVYSASQALADIPDPESEKALQSLLQDANDPMIKEAAESALSRLNNLMATQSRSQS